MSAGSSTDGEGDCWTVIGALEALGGSVVAVGVADVLVVGGIDDVAALRDVAVAVGCEGATVVLAAGDGMTVNTVGPVFGVGRTRR